MPNKFDTNPLDPDLPERLKQQQPANPHYQYDAETNRLPNYADEGAPTRTFGSEDFDRYSAFNESQPVAPYKNARLRTETPKDRKVAKIGLPENVLIALPYIPFFFGMVAGILELIFVPKSETKVRFHAAQGLAAHIGILIVTTLLGVVGNVTDLASVGNGIFQVVTTIMLVVFTIKAFQGKPIHIESVDGLTEWLEEKINPQK